MISRRLLPLALVIVLSVSACALPFLPAPAAAGGGVLIVALDGPVITLDPANATDYSSARVTTQIFETLVEHDAASGQFTPLLAQKWDVSPDGRVWTFVLRSGVTFHDGTAFDADAVVDNFNRWLDTANSAHVGEFDYWQIVFGGFKDSGSIVRSVQRADDLRVQIVLERPWGPLLAALSKSPFAMISPTAMSKDADALRLSPVGTGAFRFAGWTVEGDAVLAANKQYWAGQPKLAGLRFKIITEPAERLQALRGGSVHLLEGADSALVAQARALPSVTALMRPSQSVAFLAINQKASPFDDARVRLAVAQAINRRGLIDKAYGGLGQPADQFVPPAVAGNDRTLAPLEYSVAGARDLLTSAGYAGSIMSQLWYPTRARPLLPNPRALAEAIAADLRAAGILVVLNAAEWTTYQRRALEGGYPLYLQGWTGDIPDADSYLSSLFSGDGVARSIGYGSQELTTLLTTARAQTDPLQRAPLYRQAASVLRRDMSRVPLVYPQSPVLTATSVRGFVPAASGIESYRAITLVTP